jgi:RNA polymerase sigma-70 factor (ECF subfamily)
MYSYQQGGDSMGQTAVLQSTEEILKHYSDMVLRAAYTMVKNKHDAEDIAQDVFVSLMRAQPVFESAEHQKAWLLRVTMNRCKNFLTSSWQRKTQGLENAPVQEIPFTPPEHRVMDAVNALPLKYRQVIYLYYIEGYDTGEIASLLQLPLNTVLSQMARARKMLKKSLKGELGDV